MDERLFVQAVQEGQIDTVRQAMDENPALSSAHSEEGLPAVLLAAYYGHAQLARLLADRRGDLTIFEACVVGDLARLRALAEADPAQVNAYAADGFQPLGLAAFFNQPAVAAYLVEHGAGVNSPSGNGQRVTPLHSAAASGALEIARLLLEIGAEPNARQAGDFVPLHAAAQNGQLEMIELLLAHGAGLNLRASGGQTALGFALEANQSAAAELLRRKGAEE